MKRLVVVSLLVACKGSPEQTATAASSAPPVPSAAAAAPAAAAKAWYEGAWQGSYQAELLKIETAAGGIKAWKDDDGAKASGNGKLALQAAADGSVTGTASGPLGEHSVIGKADGDRVALSLIPADPNGFRGIILASQADAGLKGTLTASTGDSLAARRATVTLTRVAP